MVLVTGCTSSSASSSSPSGSEPQPDAGGPAAIECTAGISDELLHLDTQPSSGVALAIGEDALGVAYFDAKARINLGLVAADGTSQTIVASGAIENTHYKSYGVDLAYGQGAFGVGFSMERTPETTGAEPGWSGVGFLTVAAATKRAGAVTMANRDLDRTGGGGRGGPVAATAPHVTALDAGFLVSWSDTRTAEPTRYGVNLAYWHGIYGRAYDAKGTAKSYDDVQVQQQNSAYGFSTTATPSGVLAVWTGRSSNDSDTTLLTRLGPATGAFTIAPVSAPANPTIVTLPKVSALDLVSAVGADGNVLSAVTVRSLASETSVYAVLVDRNGKLVSSKQLPAFKAVGVSKPAVVATATGYQVVFMSGAYDSAAKGPVGDSLHVVNVDAAGVPGTDTVTAIAGGMLWGGIATRVTEGKSLVYFLTGASPSLSLHALTVCGG
ncbi:MAG: hypothetical protein HOO96_42025 [Polyangiaceae bacterium]|nr:hypothetical protein [Polyangiaceae bacterium]